MRANNPKGRSTDQEVEDRIAEAIAKLSSFPNIHKTELHKEFTVKWDCHWRTVDRIVSRAREEMMQRLNRPKETFVCESLNFYESKMVDPKATPAEQIRACQRKDELLGLDSPKRTEISGPDGKPIALKAEKTEPFDYAGFEKVQRAMFGVPSTNGNGESVHPASSDSETSRVPQSNGH